MTTHNKGKINILNIMVNTRKGRKDIEDSGYYRNFASNEHDMVAYEMAVVFSENHANVISNGNKLDCHIIPNERFNPNKVIKKIKTTLIDPNNCNGHYSQLELMKEDCPSIKKKCIQIDYVTITDDEAFIYEIKDGDTFDTKKSEGELESLEKAKGFFKRLFPNKQVYTHVVLWNARDLSKVSFKVKDIPSNFIMFGTDFCKKNNINWEAIKIFRMLEGKKNKREMIGKLRDLLAFIDIYDDEEE